MRESSLAVMDTLSKALGVDIYVYESYVNEKGQRVYLSDRGEKKAPNGYYDPSDGSIHIDLNAGQDGNGTMLFTVAHELTHFIKDWSSVKYRALADALVKQYQKRGVTVSELVDNQIAKAKKNGREISRQEAFDEVVADSMESMLTDENAAAFLEKLAQRDKGLKEKIVSWLKDLAAKLKNALSAYKDVKPDSPEGKMVAQMEDFRKEIMGIYTSALVDAGENFRENGGTLTSDGDYLYSERVTDKETLDFLNSQETVTTYKTMQIVDGELYPPMASRIGGKHEDYSVLGEWEQATEHPELIKENGKFKLDKGKGQGSISELKKAGVKINESGRVKHSYLEGGQKYSDRYISSDVDTNVLSLVERVKSGHYSDNEKVFFSTVPDKIASTIEKITGIDVKGFRVAIEARQIYHILNDHGPKGTSDHSMSDPNDIARIRYTLDDPDDIRESGTTKAYTHFKNGKNRLAPTVLYEKSIGDKSYYVVQAIPDTKAKILYIVSAFIGKSGYKKEAQQLINANGPDATAKTGSAETSNYSIRDPNSVVKQKFSDRDPTAEATRAALEKENGKLREDVSRLRELLRLQGKVTGGTVMKPSSVEAAAKWLNKYAGAKADVKELSRMLTEFYRFIATDKDYSWEDVHQRAMVIAKYLQDNVQLKPQISDYARNVLQDIRGSKITLDENQRAEVGRKYGSYEAFRKAAFGNVTFVKEGGIPLDSKWHEWASLYPGTFDSEITATDQPQALMDAIDALRNSDTTVMEYAYNRESIAQDLAVAVYDSYWRVDALVTVADRDQRKINDLTARQEALKGTISEKNAQIKKMRAEHRNEMDSLKEERNKTVPKIASQGADKRD